MLKKLLSVACIFLSGCTNNAYHFYSPEREQCISVITKGNIRYIVNGNYSTVPESNFVKIDLSKIDRNLGDEIIGCWNRDKLHWIIMMNGVTVLDNKLDTSKFLFKKDFPIDGDGIPDLKNYDRKKVNCFAIDFEYSTLRRVSGDVKQ